jgi:transcriptional regulator of acetoin/glycerol metabolism
MRAERDDILDALRASRDNQSEAARLLGMARTTLVGKMKRYGIAP